MVQRRQGRQGSSSTTKAKSRSSPTKRPASASNSSNNNSQWTPRTSSLDEFDRYFTAENMINNVIPRMYAESLPKFDTKGLMTVAVDRWVKEPTRQFYGITIFQSRKENLYRIVPTKGETFTADRIYKMLEDVLGTIPNREELIVGIVPCDSNPNLNEACDRYATKHPRVEKIPNVLHTMDEVCEQIMSIEMFRTMVEKAVRYQNQLSLQPEIAKKMKTTQLKKLLAMYSHLKGGGVRFVALLNYLYSLHEFWDGLGDLKSSLNGGAGGDLYFWREVKEFDQLFPFLRIITSMTFQKAQTPIIFPELTQAMYQTILLVSASPAFNDVLVEVCECFDPAIKLLENPIFKFACFLDPKEQVHFGSKSMFKIRDEATRIVESWIKEDKADPKMMAFFDRYCLKRLMPNSKVPPAKDPASDDKLMKMITLSVLNTEAHTLTGMSWNQVFTYMTGPGSVGLDDEHLAMAAQLHLSVRAEYADEVDDWQVDPAENPDVKKLLEMFQKMVLHPQKRQQ